MTEHPFSGMIYEIEIHNRFLGEEEVLRIYQEKAQAMTIQPPDIDSNEHVAIKQVWLVGPGEEPPLGTYVSETHIPGYRLAWIPVKEANDGKPTTATTAAI